MKDQENKNNLEEKAAKETKAADSHEVQDASDAPKKPFSYEEAGSCSDGDLLREAKMQYVYSRYKRQGEYTLEDYYALPDDQRTELIDGYLYDMAAPYTTHQIASLEISVQLANFISSRKGSCQAFYAPVDVQLDCDDRTMLQPDVLVVCDRDKIKKRCVYGAPDFVIEILSDATARKDMTIKLWKYMNAGVREYWIVDLRQEKVIVYDGTEEDGMLKNKADENRAGNHWHISDYVEPRHAELPGGNGAACVHDSFCESRTCYGMDQPAPVRIFGGECRIRFDEICEKVRPILRADFGG